MYRRHPLGIESRTLSAKIIGKPANRSEPPLKIRFGQKHSNIKTIRTL